jgi:hypothetical protein
LRILAKLHKLEVKFDDMIQNMEKHFDVKNDYLYIKGQQDAKKEFVIFLIEEKGRTFDQIADIAGTTTDFVKSVYVELSKI